MKYGKSQLLNLLETVPRRGWTWQKIKDLVDSLWRDPLAGGAAVSGLGMDFTTGDPVDLGLPSTIDSTTENALTETSHTHALGEIDAGNVIVTAADEYVLYNWWVSEGDIAPDGWHVPSQAEWETLLDGIDTKITDGSWVYWANAKNILEGLGFNFIYEGRRNNFTGQGTFDGIYEMVYAMTTSDYTLEETVLNHITTFQADKNNTFFQINAEVKGSGVGLLLIKDDSTDPGTLEDYDGNIYNTVKVGDQVWITSNFRCTCYSDGTPIPLVQDNVAWTELITAAYCIYKQPLSDVITSLENQPDEKIKYDAADPTAGYLSEKIIAGTNITIAEGIGADENKLKISVTGDIATTYLGLTDTSDTTYTAKDLHVPMVNEATSNLDLTPTELATFLILNDTPSAYTGAGGKLVAVKSDISGLEFVTQLTLPVKASGSELKTGTDDAKFATAKALKDGEFIGIHVGTSPPSDTTLLWLDTN